jgi:hypothetical protein
MNAKPESPIEESFLDEFRKHAFPDYVLHPQKEFITRVGLLRPDFVLPFGDYLMGFECDGSDYHDIFRDEVRDAILLGDGHLGTIYRFPGSTLAYAPELCISFIMQCDPELFPQRSHEVVRRKCEIADYRQTPIFHRRSARRSHAKREHWRYIYSQFVAMGLTGIDQYSPGPITI